MYAGCHATPFHFECIEVHYERAHPRSQQEAEWEGQKEGYILSQESVEARTQWVDQMMKIKRSPMPFRRKLISFAVAFASVVFVVGPSWSPAAVGTPVPLLQ